MADKGSRGFNLLRALHMAIGIAVMGAAALMVDVWAAKADPVPMPAAAMDKVIEAENEGVPAAVVRRREHVLAELAVKPPEEWAAEYYEGDGLGENMSLYVAPASGVAATWFGCMGLYGSNEGDVTIAGARTLAFHFNQPNDAGHFGMFPSTVRIVRWGSRRYLIPEDRLIDFVNAINRGMEPTRDSHSMFLLAREDHEKPVSGLPDLPDAMLAQIRSTPLQVRVSSVEKSGESGANAGAFCSFQLRLEVPDGAVLVPGLEFSTTDSDVYETARVIEANDHEATAKMRFYDKCADVKKKPVRGWLLTTGSSS